MLFLADPASFRAPYIRSAQSLKATGDALLSKDPTNLVSAVHAYTSALLVFQVIGTPEVESAQKTLEIIIRDVQRRKDEQ